MNVNGFQYQGYGLKVVGKDGWFALTHEGKEDTEYWLSANELFRMADSLNLLSQLRFNDTIRQGD